MHIDTIPIVNRACDLCNDAVTDGYRAAIKSFVLTDWGVICIRCWDGKINGHEEFKVIKVYVASQRIEDEWIAKPLAIGQSCLR